MTTNQDPAEEVRAEERREMLREELAETASVESGKYSAPGRDAPEGAQTNSHESDEPQGEEIGDDNDDSGLRSETVIRFYVLHGYRSGKGGALAMSVSPAKPGHEGSLVVSLAPQGQDPSPEEAPAFRAKKQFVWSRRLNVRLSPVEIVQMLRVLRGTLPAVGPGGNGWIHGKYTRIEVSRVEDGGRSAVRFSAGRSMQDGSRRFAWVYLDADESAVLLLALQQTLPLLVFGVPVAPPAPVFAPPPLEQPAAPAGLADVPAPLPEW